MTARRRKRALSSRRQRGVVLFISIAIMVLLSLFAISTMNNAMTENRMAAAARDLQLAQLGADSALNEAEATISTISLAHGAAQVCSVIRCVVRDVHSSDPAGRFMDSAAAMAARISFTGVDFTKLAGVDASTRLAEAPSYVVEDLGPDARGPTFASKAAGERRFRIIARGVGATPRSVCVLEHVYAVATVSGS